VRRIIEGRLELGEGGRVDGEEHAIGERLDGGAARGLQHEVCARLAGQLGGAINQPAFVRPDLDVEHVTARVFGQGLGRRGALLRELKIDLMPLETIERLPEAGARNGWRNVDRPSNQLNTGAAVICDDCVIGDQDQRLREGLGNDEPVERILVNWRQAIQGCRVLARNS